MEIWSFFFWEGVGIICIYSLLLLFSPSPFSCYSDLSMDGWMASRCQKMTPPILTSMPLPLRTPTTLRYHHYFPLLADFRFVHPVGDIFSGDCSSDVFPFGFPFVFSFSFSKSRSQFAILYFSNAVWGLRTSIYMPNGKTR